MHGRVFVDGRKVADFEYDLPKREDGKEIQVPRGDGLWESDLGVIIRGPEHMVWWAKAKFETIDDSPQEPIVFAQREFTEAETLLDYQLFICKHRARSPSGLCTDCGSTS